MDTSQLTVTMSRLKDHARQLYRRKLEAGLEYGIPLSDAAQEAERYTRAHIQAQVHRALDGAIAFEEVRHGNDR